MLRFCYGNRRRVWWVKEPFQKGEAYRRNIGLQKEIDNGNSKSLGRKKESISTLATQSRQSHSFELSFAGSLCLLQEVLQSGGF